jgi:uncharacterized protein GlcG (DUF336 family)
VSVVDRRGEPIQQDVMDGAPSAGAEVAQATAAAAATFACPSQGLHENYGRAEGFAQVAAALPFAVLGLPGAVPILQDGVAVAAVGVGGASPAACAQIAAEARDSL